MIIKNSGAIHETFLSPSNTNTDQAILEILFLFLQVIRDLKEEIFPSSKFVERSLSGKGNGRIKWVTFQDAIELIMVLPGKIAKETRSKFAKIIERYLAGDESLIGEIKANAQSSEPVSQLARMASSVRNEMEEEDRKRKREIEQTELLSKKIANVKGFAETMSMINPHWSNDARLRMQTEDWLKNIVFNANFAISHNAPSQNGGVEANTYRTITIGEVAGEMGKRLNHSQSIKAGVLAAKKFQEKYGVKPPKQRRWVDNAEREVCVYMEKDKQILVETLQALDLL